MRWSVVLAGSLTALAARDAQAQLASRGAPVMQFRLQTAYQWQRSLPSTAVTGTPTEARELNGELPTTGPASLLSYATGFDLVLRDRYLIPILDMELAHAVGRYPVVYGAVDGSVIETHPWTTWQTSFLLGGIGRRWKHRRWAYEVVAQPGFLLSFMGIESASISGDRVSVGAHVVARATVTGCRRIDPVSRVCLVGLIHLFQDSFVNGGGLGLRWELGP